MNGSICTKHQKPQVHVHVGFKGSAYHCSQKYSDLEFYSRLGISHYISTNFGNSRKNIVIDRMLLVLVFQPLNKTT